MTRPRAIAAAVVAAVTLSGCGNLGDPNATFSAVRVTPMGSGQAMVSCVDSPTYCANAATQVCPSGFSVESNVVNAADYGRMTMIIKCK